MIVWVLYDIKDDRTRSNVAKWCKQIGLYRVQYSCFLGNLEKNQMDTLALKIEEAINEAEDKVYILPMNQAELRQTQLLGQAFDKDMLTDEVRALFF